MNELAETAVTVAQVTLKALLVAVTYTLSVVAVREGFPIVVAVTTPLPLRAKLATVIISGRPKLMVLPLDTFAR